MIASALLFLGLWFYAALITHNDFWGVIFFSMLMLVCPVSLLLCPYVQIYERVDPQCPKCSYSLVGNVSGACPECGTPLVGKAG